MKFCTECGAPFRARCSRCGFENPPRAKFCGECGSPLAPQPWPPVSGSTFQVSGSQHPDPGLRTSDPGRWTPPHLAEAYGKLGQAEEGLSALAEALTAVDKTGERFYEAELYRLKGQLTLQSKQVEDKSQASQGQVEDNSENANPQPPAPSTQAEAEACFHKAIEVAQGQSAKSLELRAAMSLSRLWQQQGK